MLFQQSTLNLPGRIFAKVKMELLIRTIRLLSVFLMVWTAAAATASGAAAAGEEQGVVVFAAASTTNAITEIGTLFSARGLGRIKPSFASSSTLAKQIANGAPAHIFLSANEKWMDFLEEEDLLAKGSRFDLLSNQIVLVAPEKSPLARITVKPEMPLAAMLADGRLAIGDPDHVPAGIYGKQALQNLGLWESIKDRLAPMKDVRAALVLTERGETPLGLVYATDAAISKKVRVIGIFPTDSHSPIVYPVALVAGHQTPQADRFIVFLGSPEAGAVFEKYGFRLR